MKAVDQDLFDTFFSLSTKLGYPTYDYLPGKTAEYPFVVIGAVNIGQTLVKLAKIETVSLTIDIWGKREQRQKVSTIMDELDTQAHLIKSLRGYRVVYSKMTTKQIIGDTSTSSFLWHGILDLQMRII